MANIASYRDDRDRTTVTIEVVLACQRTTAWNMLVDRQWTRKHSEEDNVDGCCGQRVE